MSNENPVRPIQLDVSIERWPLIKPFRITGRVSETFDVVTVRLSSEGHVGRGEAAGVYYLGETVASVADQIRAFQAQLNEGLTRADLLSKLPVGGARNALDCALWDLEAKRSGRAAWESAGLARPRSLLTTFTCGADTPGAMAARALAFEGARAIKLKLTGEADDAARVKAVRDALPDVWIGVDANQGFSQTSFDRPMPTLVDARVGLLEQPFPMGREGWLDGVRSPIPIAADESVQSTGDIERLVGRFNTINIKLDKCGGMTEAFAMVAASRAHGFDVMVGCMGGTSLAMSPAFLVGQLCDIVDLDAPVLLQSDRCPHVEYCDGHVDSPPDVWGSP